MVIAGPPGIGWRVPSLGSGDVRHADGSEFELQLVVQPSDHRQWCRGKIFVADREKAFAEDNRAVTFNLIKVDLPVRQQLADCGHLVNGDGVEIGFAKEAGQVGIRLYTEDGLETPAVIAAATGPERRREELSSHPTDEISPVREHVGCDKSRGCSVEMNEEGVRGGVVERPQFEAAAGEVEERSLLGADEPSEIRDLAFR